MSGKKRPKVLLADDEPHIRLLMKTVLESMGCDIAGQAVNGQEAVEMFKKTAPDIVLLDINMPIMDGIGALKEIKAAAPSAFVVMLTSLSTMEVVEECIQLGANHYLRKDNPINEIKKQIKESWAQFKTGG